MIITALILFFALIYLFVFLGVMLFKIKLRKLQRRAEEEADQSSTQYADGQIFYSKTDTGKKHFRQSDGEYVDYEEV